MALEIWQCFTVFVREVKLLAGIVQRLCVLDFLSNVHQFNQRNYQNKRSIYPFSTALTQLLLNPWKQKTDGISIPDTELISRFSFFSHFLILIFLNFCWSNGSLKRGRGAPVWPVPTVRRRRRLCGAATAAESPSATPVDSTTSCTTWVSPPSPPGGHNILSFHRAIFAIFQLMTSTRSKRLSYKFNFKKSF